MRLLIPIMSLFFWLIIPPTRSKVIVVGGAQFPEPARALDSLLQHHAYASFAVNPRPRTGVSYRLHLPSNFTGIKASAIRFRSGSLRKRGVHYIDGYPEFQVPPGIVVRPYVERLILVYQNLGNLSSQYYPLPPNYVFLAPVLGLVAYDASNLSSDGFPVVDIRASLLPISIRFPEVKSGVPVGSVAKCVYFDLSAGLLNFSSLLSDNTCATFQEGHFSVVVESPAPTRSSIGGGEDEGKKKKKKPNSEIWIIVGPVTGGTIILVITVLLVTRELRLKSKRRMQMMERAAEAGESLQITTVGSTKAPSATFARTQPTIETEYFP